MYIILLPVGFNLSTIKYIVYGCLISILVDQKYCTLHYFVIFIWLGFYKIKISVRSESGLTLTQEYI